MPDLRGQIGPNQPVMVVNPATNRLYVANPETGTLKVIDGASGTTLAVPVTSGLWGLSMAVNPVTNKIYLVGDRNTALVLDGATNTVSPITVGGTPYAVAVNPVTNKIYVANLGSDTVTAVDGATGVTSTIAVTPRPLSLAVNPVTNRIYVSGSSGTTIIDGTNNSTTTINTGGGSGGSQWGVAVNPVTNRVYVSNYLANTVSVIDGGTNAITTVNLTQAPGPIEIDVASNKIYVSTSSSVAVIDGATNAVSFIAPGTLATSLSLNPLTRQLYVERNNSVSVIDLVTNAATTISTALQAGVVVNPVTNRVYLCTSDGTLTTIDAATYSAPPSWAPTGQATTLAAVNPVTNRGYAVSSTDGSVTVVDGLTGSVVATVPGGGTQPSAIAVNSATNKIYVAYSGSNRVMVINGADNTTVNVTTGAAPSSIAVNPATNKVYVADGSGLTVIDGFTNAVTAIPCSATVVAVNPATNLIYLAATGSMNVINGANNTFIWPNSTVQSIPAAPPGAIAVNPATGTVYVTYPTANRVVLIPPGLNNLGVYVVPNQPTALAIDPTNDKVYATNPAAGTVTVADGDTFAYSTIAVGTNPSWIDVNPATNKIFVANQGSTFLSVIDGDSNTARSVDPSAGAASVVAIAANPLASSFFVALSGSGGAAMMAEQKAQTIGLAAAVTPLPQNQTNGASVTFSFSATNQLIAANDPVGVFYQMDTLQGAWSQASAVGATFSATISGLLPGLHTLYYYAADAQNATSTQADGPLTGNLQAYQFLVNAPSAIAITSGNGQSAARGTRFAAGLQVKVTDGSGQPLAGIAVIFQSPVTGAGCTFTTNLSDFYYFISYTDASGIAGAWCSANSATGSYSVTASAGTGTVSFSLTNTPSPALTISKTHVGNFAKTQQGATYTVTVSNQSGAGFTSGQVTVTETVPAGLTLVSMSGTDWTCPNPGNTCKRSDPLAGGSAYPAITVTVNVPANATSPQLNSVTVTGGGSATATATDSTIITPPPCSYSISPSTVTFGVAGGAGSVTVTTPATCPWTASSALGWLGVEWGGTAGAGNGTVNYTVASNSGAPRSGSFTVAGQTFTVVQAGPYLINTIAGSPSSAVAAPGASISLEQPSSVAVDASGNVYFPSTLHNIIYKRDTSGLVTRVAGSGTQGFSGDNGPALSAALDAPFGVAVDSTGAVYISDSGRIRKVAANGTITTVAGGGSLMPGDNGPATNANLNAPEGIAIDNSGNLYIAEVGGHRIRKVAANGNITTVAGTGTAGFSGDNGPATSAQLNFPYGVAVDATGNLYIADSGNYRIRKVSVSGTITTVAGSGGYYYSGDNILAVNANFAFPIAVAVDPFGNLYIADSANYRIRRVDATSRIVTTVAGDGVWDFVGDGGPATSGEMLPQGVAVSSSGDLYIADWGNNRIRMVSHGLITTVAGGASGDGGPASLALFNQLGGAAVDNAGNLYFVDTDNSSVRKLSPNGTLTTVAGTGTAGYSGDNGPAVTARLSHPTDVSVDAAGNVYVSDTNNDVVRKITVSTGVITSIGSNAGLQRPSGVALDGANNLYIVDNVHARVQKIDTLGVVTTVAGTGVPGYAGDGGEATAARLSQGVEGLVVDVSGNLYIADGNNYAIRKVDKNGVITTVAGTGVAGYSGDGGPAASAQLSTPAALAVDGYGNLFIAELFGIRMVTSLGTITTIAGPPGPCCNPTGDGGPALLSEIAYPRGIALDAAGNIYVTQSYANSVRMLTPVGTQPVLTVASSHAGSFSAGKTGTYTLTVTNSASAGSTNGTVTLAEIVPSWLTITAMGGTGWTCNAPLCWRSNTLDGGSSYPPVTVTVNVATGAPSQVTNQATVSGGGAPMVATQDFTLITPPPVLSIAKSHSGNFTQGQTGATYTLTVSNTGTVPTGGQVTVTENVPSGMTLVSMNGPLWDCSASPTCTTSVVLNAGSSYPPITVTVNVKSNATSPQTNSVSVSGGGSTIAYASDVTTILLSQTITFGTPANQQLGTAPFTISVNSSSGLPVSLTSQTTLVCTVSGTTVTLVSVGTCTIQATQAGNATYTAAASVTRSFLVTQGTLTGTALAFVPITPCRVADTRNPTGPFGGPTLTGGSTRNIPIPSGACGIPSTAQVYSLNAAVVPTGGGWITLWGAGQPQPLAASVNSPDGRVKSNGAIVPAGTGGAISVYASVTTDLVLDVNGYFVPASTNPTALAFYPVTPCRIADTRNANGSLGGPYMSGGSTRTFPVLAATACNIPSSAQAFSLNLAVVPLTATLGWLTAWPTGQSQPYVASLNDPPGVVLSNGAIVPAPSDHSGQISIYATQDTHVIIDINGYFAPPGTGGLYLYAVQPCRVLDTRYPSGSSPYTGTVAVDVVDSGCGAPSTAKDYVFNATVVPPTGAKGYMTMWPQGLSMPLAANLNTSDGAITGNMALVPTSNGWINAYFSGTTHLVLDLFGYFAP